VATNPDDVKDMRDELTNFLPTTIYPTQNSAPQEVWKVDGTTGEKTVLATIFTGNNHSNPFPSKNLGLGQIAHHRTHKQLYVTSLR
jgi:hypothetical protein